MLVITTLAFGLLLGLTLIGGKQLFAAGKYVYLVWEAEDVKTNGKAFHARPYKDDPVGKVSGGKVLAIDKVKPGEHVAPDKVFYKVNIPRDGVYFLWARTLWSTGCGNSVLTNISGYSNDWVLGGDATYDCLHWICLCDGGDNNSRPRPLQLKKGPVTITLKSVKGGIMVDEFLLTTDKDEEAQGAMKPSDPSVLLKDTSKSTGK